MEYPKGGILWDPCRAYWRAILTDMGKSQLCTVKCWRMIRIRRVELQLSGKKNVLVWAIEHLEYFYILEGRGHFSVLTSANDNDASLFSVQKKFFAIR